MKTININDIIFVKLTPYGKEVYEKKFDYLNSLDKNLNLKPAPLKSITNKDGLTSFQLFDFMNIFGQYMLYYDYNHQVIVNNIIYIKNDVLKAI